MADRKVIAVVGATGAQGGGLARAILADKGSGFAVRAISRKKDSDKARALANAGAEVVEADTDNAASLDRAFAGCYGAYCVTNFWEHLSADREMAQAGRMAQAAKKAGLQHVIWSTLEDTRVKVPLSDNRLPTLHDKFKVPHFDGKGASDHLFADAGVPTTYLLAAFYWENFIYFGLGPRQNQDGSIVLALPLGGTPLPGIATEDIGRSALGIFRKGVATVAKRLGIAGENLTGEQMASKMGRALGKQVSFYDVPFAQFRALGFPGADDLGNMFEYQHLIEKEFLASRDPRLTRELDPALLDFDGWLAVNAGRIPIG
jgi:uncharacterized protein YbjT (DUF2867 family)